MMFFRLRRVWNNEMQQLNAACKAVVKADIYYSDWKASQKEGRGPMADKMPWMSYPAIDHLRQFVHKNMRVFEYGGGGSTLFFTERAGKVITVEHNPEWFAKLESDLSERAISNWEGYLIQEEPGAPADASIADPYAYISDDADYKGMNFRSYASYIDRYPDESFDLIIVDGRARPSCTMHAIPKLKKGGWLIIDNADRTYYLEAFQKTLSDSFEVILHCKAPTPYCTWFTQTSIWKKR